MRKNYFRIAVTGNFRFGFDRIYSTRPISKQYP